MVKLGIAVAIVASGLSGCATILEPPRIFERTGQYPVEVAIGGPYCAMLGPRRPTYLYPPVLWGLPGGAASMQQSSLGRRWASHEIEVMAPTAESSAGMVECGVAFFGEILKRAAPIYVAERFGVPGQPAHEPGIRLIAARNGRGPLMSDGLSLNELLLSSSIALILSDTVEPTAEERALELRAEQAVGKIVWIRPRAGASETLDDADIATITTAWLRYQLRGSIQGRQWFEAEDCTLCGSPRWSVQRLGRGDLAALTKATRVRERAGPVYDASNHHSPELSERDIRRIMGQRPPVTPE